MILIKNAPKVKEIPLDYPSDYGSKSIEQLSDSQVRTSQLET